MTRWVGGQTPARVELVIGELELVGIPAGSRHAIAGALERTLGELLAARGWPNAAGDGALQIEARHRATPGATPEQLGRAIAEAIVEAATRERSR